MLATSDRRPRVGAVLIAVSVVLGLTACMPVGIRVSPNGLSLSSLGFFMSPAGLNFGSSQGSSVPVETPADGPREVAATFHSELACEDRIGLGQGAGFVDYETLSCHACPAGYARAPAPVSITDPMACRPIGVAGLFQSAESLGPLGCAPDTFQIDDGCYSCPADTVATGNDDVGTACLTNS